MNNYRITFKFKHANWSYENEFRNYFSLYPEIKQILDKGKQLGITHMWYFFEPYAEINWLSDDKHKSIALINWFKEEFEPFTEIEDVKYLYPEDGLFGDWFCDSEEERLFGAKRHDVCRQWIDLYHAHKDAVDSGKGLDRQVGRTIHTLCNPLGLNYMDEARICFKRGLVCWLYMKVGPKITTFVITKIFRWN